MRMKVIVAVAASVFIGCLGAAVIRAEQGQSRPGPSKHEEDKAEADELRIETGLRYAKAQGIQLDFKKKDRDSVGLGSYLVNSVGGCNDCHTAPPFTVDPFSAPGVQKQVNVACYLAGGQEFGPFVSRDITPFEDGKPAGLTFQQFRRVIRTGEDPDNPGQLLQVMPWPVYQTMTDHDLRAVYDYLSAVPPIAVNTCGTPSE